VTRRETVHIERAPVYNFVNARTEPRGAGDIAKNNVLNNAAYYS
jgi:hypothetical protein